MGQIVRLGREGGGRQELQILTANFVQLVVNRLCRQNTGGADFVDDFTGLVEHECQDIFVVGHGDDGLQDQLARSHHGRTTGAIVGVLPANPAVLLVDADAVLEWNGRTLVVGDDGTQVLNVAQAITAQFEIVGHGASTGIAEVECRLLVVRVTGVAVGNVHIREGQAVKQGARVVSDIVENHAFTLVVAHAERPLLPVKSPTRFAHGGDGE